MLRLYGSLKLRRMSAKPKARLYTSEPLALGGAVPLTKEQAHYLRNVMRFEPGEEVALFNGRDGEWRGLIAELGKKAGSVGLERQVRQQAAEPDVWLLFAPIKKARMDFVVEKATELGASRVWPVATHRTQSARVNEDRVIAQTIEAAEQCERLTLPEVTPGCSLETALKDWPAERRLFVLDETGQGKPVAETLPAFKGEPAAFLIGPEGGFAQDELEILRSHAAVTSLSLGARILRAETAVVAALSCWQALCGDWQ